MRISDWSSDVCSSDLEQRDSQYLHAWDQEEDADEQAQRGPARHRRAREAPQMAVRDAVRERPDETAREQFLARRRVAAAPVPQGLLVAMLVPAHPRSFSSPCLSSFPSRSLIVSLLSCSLDRTDVFSGTSVSYRVVPGVSRVIKQP